MPFSIPTLAEISTRIETDIVSRLGTSTPLRRSFVKVIARIEAGAVYLLYQFLAWIAKQVFPDTAEKEYLERWAAVWGVTRIAATFAAGAVTFTGTDTTVIPAGTVLQNSNGTEYTTDADGTITGGTVNIAVTCSDGGETGNALAGVTLSLLTPISGVNTSATVAGGGLTGGIDEQDDDGLLAAVLRRIQQPPHGGNQNDYVNWALEVAGVTRAWCTPLKYGAGTVGLTFVRDGDVSIIPDAGEVTAVQDYIDPLKPVTADLTVYAPTAKTVNFTIQISPNTAAVQAAITAELTDLFSREAEPGVTLLISHIRNSVSNAAGENDSVVTLPAGNVVPLTDEIPVIGTISYSTLS